MPYYDGNADNVNIVNEVELATDTTAGSGGEASSSFEIEIADFQFGPADAVVPAGTEVVWLNNDTDVHSIISTGDLFASSDTFEPGESYAVTFSDPEPRRTPAASTRSWRAPSPWSERRRRVGRG